MSERRASDILSFLAYEAEAVSKEAASHAYTLNQAADAAREISRAFGVVDCNSDDYKSAFEIACNAALAADAAHVKAGAAAAKAAADAATAAARKASIIAAMATRM
jgi:hypothetical protein